MFLFQLGFGNSFHHRTYCFQVGRVGCQADGNFSSLVIDSIVIPQVIFYVAVLYLFFVVFSGKPAKNLGVRLFHDICQYVEPSPVGHSYYNIVYVVRSSVRNDGVQGWNNSFRAFQRKPFLPHVLSVHIIFKPRCFDQVVEDVQFFFVGKGFLVSAAFHFLL
ncbi:hypothetical protein SDC9_71913 [bioreactor metagenome]|uniref:Uncharacterized protein n=1 Tax=bioreactor metagenome TaxID=1076179 RepID=A0A644YAS9_9ZZZZ